jgi:FKBP-type peptidyl-prolyl cis-trans isomerase
MMQRKIAGVILAMGLGMTACGGKEDKDSKPANKDTTKELQSVNETPKRETLPSGLAFEVITKPAADAKAPAKGNQVEVHYTGWLNVNGKPAEKAFDSSVTRGFPFKFTLGVGQVIAGWDEGVALMKVGEKRRYFIPSKLGYGAYGAGAAIPPNADLIFDVEFLAIK